MAASIDSKYSLEILSPTGTIIIELSGRADKRELSFTRNGSYNASWAIDLDLFEYLAAQIETNPRSILSAGKNTIMIKRLGVPLFSGQIAFYEGTLGDKKELSVKVLGWLDLLKDRYTSIVREFGTLTDTGTWVDAAEIAWTLIEESQAFNANSDLGITEGTLQTSVNRYRKYELKNIRDAIQELTSVNNGFDFEITPERAFNAYYPKMGVRREELVFSYPGNVKNFKVITDATQVMNYAVVRGQGFGEGQIIDIRQDTASQENYKLRQGVLDFSDIPNIETLQDLGDEEISQFAQPLEVLELTVDGNRQPFIGAYWVGDEIKVETEGVVLYEHINGYYRIEEINVKIDENDSEEIQLKLVAV